MAKNLHKEWMIAVIYTVISVMQILCTDIPGQARPDDPHACLWFIEQSGSRIFRCCDGYFKIDAKNQTEECTECPDGSYGTFCQNSCTCVIGGTCNKVDGSCRCSAGYFGNNCQYHCNCQNGATCMSDGTCVCADGFYGKLCQSKCSCPEHSECISKTGECICHDGFYGSLCLPCSCLNTEQCDPFSGACSCRPGYYGELCDKECACFNGAYCGDDSSDDCKCSSGWVGYECTDCDAGLVKSNGLLFCEDKCLHCYNGYTCSVEGGDCQCTPGWQGNRCDQTCDEGFYGNNCSGVCRCKSGVCDHVTGICHCDIGWTGTYCEVPCPANCVVCDDDICVSCKPGWTGERCTTRCEPGFYGGSCQEQCTECNCSKFCHHVNGHCKDVVRCEEHKCKYQNVRTCTENPFKLECQDGWTGHMCDVTKTVTLTDDGLSLDKDSSGATDDGPLARGSYRLILIMICLCATVAVCIVILSVGVLLRKKSSSIKFYDKICCSHHEKETPTSGKDDVTSEQCMSTQSARGTGSISKCDTVIVFGTDSKQTPVHASVLKPSKEIQLSNLNVNDANYDQFGKSRTEQDNHSNTDNGVYELLGHAQQTD